MIKQKTKAPVSDEMVINKILMVREKKVMIDQDLAELYGVPTKRLNEQVKRNLMRFPGDFMFRLTQEEKHTLIENHPHLNNLKFSPSLPFVFTEHGAIMLASVLNSETAIAVNVQIIRIFVRMREILLAHNDILLKLMKLEKETFQHDHHIKLIFKYLRELISPPNPPSRKIGFRLGNGPKLRI